MSGPEWPVARQRRGGIPVDPDKIAGCDPDRERKRRRLRDECRGLDDPGENYIGEPLQAKDELLKAKDERWP